MPKRSIETQFSEIVESGNYTLDADDLKDLDVQVYAMTREQYDKMYGEWVALGMPLFDVPIFPREEIE